MGVIREFPYPNTDYKLTVFVSSQLQSTLGPLLFLIYINDLPNSSDLLQFRIFSDDTNLYSTLLKHQMLFKIPSMRN